VQATARVCVGNVEPHEEKRGNMSDDISNVNNKMFQFNDNIISSTGSTRRRE
jgi:ABC-type transporter lipoprotein component MlaA